MFYEIIIIIPFVREGKCREVRLFAQSMFMEGRPKVRVLIGKDAWGKRIDFIFWTLNGLCIK